MRARYYLFVAILAFSAQPLEAAITGNPLSDGWTSHGNSLSNGIYVRGSANYGFDTYSTTLTVDDALNAASGWSVGDTVIGVGGVFSSILAGDAEWDAFSGNAVNQHITNAKGPKIQAKFGTGVDVTTPWSTSTIAPGTGNGVGSLGNGGTGSIQVRSSAEFQFALGDWSNYAGQLMDLDKPGHIEAYGASSPAANVARLIWNVNSNGQLSSWQILLNASLIDGFTWDGQAILTVQNVNSDYTDALIVASPANAVVPEPASLVVWSLLALTVGGAGWWRRRKNAE